MRNTRVIKLEKVVSNLISVIEKLQDKMKEMAREKIKKRFGIFSALCVNTLDRMAEGRVQYYTPGETEPGTSLDSLPWAYSISPFGGFDDSGVTWIPPAGSKLALFYEQGDVNQAYYLGTFWFQSRGLPSGSSDDDSQINSTNPGDNMNDLLG